MQTAGPDKLKVKYSLLKIVTGSDLSKWRLPLMRVESGKPGPVLWLTACCHGDEVGGIVTIQEVFKRLRRVGLLKGSVWAFPLMNPIGFEAVSRKIPISKEDLNRSYPGNTNGSLGERIADIIFSTIINTHPTVVLDIHNDWIRSIPYALIDLRSEAILKSVHAELQKYAHTLGFIVIRDSSEMETTLTYNLLTRHIPALTLELGESYIVNEENINYGVKSIFNLLEALKMTAPAYSGPFRYPLPHALRGKTLGYSDRPLSSTSGIIRFMAEPGEFVFAGHTIAKIYNAFGRLKETIKIPHNGFVLGHADTSVAHPGMPLMAFGCER